jgi:peptidoglycan/xylan/chitin deacetylase (PgdA/CDA1 family)
LLIIVLISLFFSSCFFDPDPDANGGVVLTFDDRNVADWVWADSVLSVFDWKASFCVAGPQVLTTSQFADLRNLKAQGHEIAGHGIAHLNAVDYVAANGMDAYLNDEILPMIDIMEQENLRPITFAYPYGDRSDEIDDTLLTYFKVLRSTTYPWSEPSAQTCYYENDPLVYGLGTDGSPTESRISYFLSLLDYARANKKILIVYSHKPVPEWTGANQTDIRTLQAICNYVTVNNMRFYTLAELHDKSASKILHALRPQ